MSNIAELYETFGLEQPAEEPESGNEPGVAAPAEETSENNQDVAEPDADVDTDALEEEPEEPGQEPKREPMSKEARAANAKRRRQQEIDEAVNKALEQERGRFSRFLQQAQIKNVYADGKVIATIDDGEAWAEADRLAKVEKDLSKGKLTPEALRLAVEQSPMVQQMQEQMTASARAAEAAQRQQFSKSVEVELAEIAKLDPTVKSLADILSKEGGKKWAGYVQNNGMSYLDAYKLAFHDEIVARAQNAAQTGAAMKERGKSHLKATGSRGQGAVEVPARIKDFYRQFQPGMTDAEIEADYNKRMQE